MATLISAMFGCDTVDKKATEPIMAQLSAKYGKTFTVYALGDRINNDTATAFVFAENDPTMLFIARSTPNGILVFENYAYRSICRKVETITNAAFTKFGIRSECFADFSDVNNDVSLDISIEDYIKYNSPDSVVVTIIVETSNNLTGENLTSVYNEVYSQLAGIRFGTALFVLTEKDFEGVADSVRFETQVFDAYRLKVSGAEDDIKELNLSITNDGLSLSADAINTALAKEVE